MSGIRVCIDTNVFLNVLNRERKFYSDSKRVLNAVDQGKLIAVIPTLVIAEILTGFYTDNKDDKSDQFLSTIIANKNIEVVQLSIEIAALAEVIWSRTGLKFPDSMILATSIHEKANYLVTNDGNFSELFHGMNSLNLSELSKLL